MKIQKLALSKAPKVSIGAAKKAGSRIQKNARRWAKSMKGV